MTAAMDLLTVPAGNEPKFTSEIPNVASSAATAMSLPSTIDSPPPKQYPLTMLITGFG